MNLLAGGWAAMYIAMNFEEHEHLNAMTNEYFRRESTQPRMDLIGAVDFNAS